MAKPQKADPNKIVISNTLPANHISSYAPSKMDDSFTGKADYWLSYLPPYSTGKDLYQGIANKDAWRVIKNLGGQALTTALTLAGGGGGAFAGRTSFKGLGSWLYKNVGPKYASELAQSYIHPYLPRIKVPKRLSAMERLALRKREFQGPRRSIYTNISPGLPVYKGPATILNTKGTHPPYPPTPKLNRGADYIAKGENVFIRSPMGGHIRPPGKKQYIRNTMTPTKSRKKGP